MKILVLAFGALAILSVTNAAPGLWFSDDGPQCKAPNGGGLQSVLDEFVDLLPMDKILSIYITAVSTDSQVEEAIEYLQSDEFKNILTAIINAPNFYELMEYGCEKLYFDAYYHYNKFAEIFDLPSITRPPFTFLKKTSTTKKRSGLEGMLLDIYDVIPVDKVKEMFENKLKNDEYVKLAMELLSSDDFKKMVKLVESLEEYNELLNKLRSMNIDIDSVIAAVKKFFKWD